MHFFLNKNTSCLHSTREKTSTTRKKQYFVKKNFTNYLNIITTPNY